MRFIRTLPAPAGNRTLRELQPVGDLAHRTAFLALQADGDLHHIHAGSPAERLEVKEGQFLQLHGDICRHGLGGQRYFVLAHKAPRLSCLTCFC